MQIKHEDFETIQKRLHRIKDIIREHDYNNYILDSPTISEYDYSKLIEEMKSLEQKIDSFSHNN
ncbi:MAG: hypothetical protein KDF60_17010 [Calditrichaeota bacterium]|nr:hypothetical protein [Calditrichota bacterium]